MTTYSIDYTTDKFFSSDPNMPATFPFQLSAVKNWAKNPKLNNYIKSPKADSIDSLFHPELSKVIISNQSEFVNDFLPKNMIIATNFDNIWVSTKSSVPTLNQTTAKTTVNGYAGYSINTFSGSNALVIGNPGRQRAVYQDSCTINHLHYPNNPNGSKGCSVQTVKHTVDGSSYEKCVCNGIPVFSDEIHSHCSEFTNNIANAQEAYYASLSASRGSSSGYDISSNETIGEKIEVAYTNSGTLKDTDRLIRQAIYAYYVEVNTNATYTSQIESKTAKGEAASQALRDSTTNYKMQYLNVFNVLSGIVIVGGYIYGM